MQGIEYAMQSILKRHARLIGVVAFLALLLALFHVSGLRSNWNLQFLRDQLTHHSVYGIVFFVLLFSLGNLVQIPGWIFLAAAVLALGPIYGGLATYVAACVSCVLTFVLIRFLGGDALRAIQNPRVNKVLARLDKHPLQSMVIARMLFQTLPALNYALAMSGVKLKNYILATLLGLPVPIALYCIFFDQLAAWLHIK